MRKLSFKMRITIFTGIIVLMTALSLTVISMLNAQKQISLVISSNSQDTAGDVSYSMNMSEETPEIQTDAMQSDDVSYMGIDLPDMPIQQYTITSSPVRLASRRFNITSIFAMIVIAALGMIFAYVFAGKSLKPIKELDSTAARITEHDLNTRLPECGAGDEISSLTNSFNSMLDRLDEAFENQKRFSSNAAHELKTPVAVMKAGLQTLDIDENADIDDYREVFAVMSRNLNRLADIVDDLLTLTNKTALPCENVPLNVMLSGIAEEMSAKYADKNVKVRYDFEKEFFILCPETLAHRLFCNLIENAFKYNRQNGKIVIAVTENDGCCRVSISDSGIGIPEKELDNIWDAFYCVDPSRSKKLGGVGLGLSVVKEIADCFNWNISAASDGNGSKFTVECHDV